MWSVCTKYILNFVQGIYEDARLLHIYILYPLRSQYFKTYFISMLALILKHIMGTEIPSFINTIYSKETMGTLNISPLETLCGCQWEMHFWEATYTKANNGNNDKSIALLLFYLVNCKLLLKLNGNYSFIIPE